MTEHPAEVGELVQYGPVLRFECGCSSWPFSSRGMLINSIVSAHAREIADRTLAWVEQGVPGAR